LKGRLEHLKVTHSVYKPQTKMKLFKSKKEVAKSNKGVSREMCPCPFISIDPSLKSMNVISNCSNMPILIAFWHYREKDQSEAVFKSWVKYICLKVFGQCTCPDKVLRI
jgi:hypothetical protein